MGLKKDIFKEGGEHSHCFYDWFNKWERGEVRKRERELEKDSSRNSPLDWFSIIREREERERREREER